MEIEEPSLEAIVYRKAIERVYTLLLQNTLKDKKGVEREEALRELVKIEGHYEAKWAEESLPNLNVKGDDAKVAWGLDQLSVQRMRPGHWNLEEHIVVKNTPEEVIVHDTSWCPLIKVAKFLGLEQRDICGIFPGRDVAAVMKVVNPKIKMKLGKLRPKDNYCEYQYILEP